MIQGTLLRHTKEITLYKSIQLFLTERFNFAVNDLDVKIGFHPNSLSSGQRPRDITEPLKTVITKTWVYIHMSHFAYACKMRYPLNLVLESWEYLWFY